MMIQKGQNSGLRIPSGDIRPINGGTPLCRWYQGRELVGNSSKRNFGRSISARDSSTIREKSFWN
ncbi:hypothetical protein EPI10_024382 [Gossypium australe]|uniref:Uncharacterized protein n=1 Tax=Gossypium australe TaxID=47621 RepID=A0A5B6VY95_9ROSI|nr:hypothetical protein EPI10_024382 [Gossypium australe]